MSDAPSDRRVVVSNLTKRYGSVVAVDDLSFTVEPGRVTGFLGPNGAGKTTTLRMVLGLTRPSSGTATIGGRRYADLVDPQLDVGVVLEATGAHAGRSGRDHLRIVAAPAGLPDTRIADVLELTGLTTAAARPVRAYSLGMRQRLALAAALVGDPAVLVLDEPTNGLDPEGIRWMRELLTGFAAEGRTVLVSSHLLSEMAVLADELVIIAGGVLVGRGTVGDLVARVVAEAPPTDPTAAPPDLEDVFLRLTRGRTALP